MYAHPQDFKEIAWKEIAKQEQRDFVVMVAGVFNYLCDKAMEDYGNHEQQEEAKKLGAAIRENSLMALPSLLEEFEANATRNGIKVLWAEDAEEARQIVKSLVDKHQARVIIKGKSMLSEEIGLNHYLEETTGAEIYEGDLGEFIVQQNNTTPFHIVGPAINMKVQQIADVLGEHIDMPYTESAEEIADYVRTFLRTKFERADMGITGVNQAIASTGSLLLIENEGNIRWATTAPRIHVALMSIEKVCSNLTDAFYLAGLLTRNCTGQAITSYVSIINGPRKTDDKDGPEEIYLVIIDNGRSKVYQDTQLRQALRCIRCGRCGIKCPVYLRIGAYPYGGCYPGPMGVVLMPLLLGMDNTRDLYEACTMCGACQQVCPSGVPHVELYSLYRQMKAQGNPEYNATPVSRKEKCFFQIFARGIRHPRIYHLGVRVSRYYMNMKAKNGYLSRLGGPFRGWFECRDLPIPPKTSFHQKWAKELCQITAETNCGITSVAASNQKGEDKNE